MAGRIGIRATGRWHASPTNLRASTQVGSPSTARSRTPVSSGARAVSGRELALALFELTEDVAVAAAHVVRHPPDVDRAKDAERADVDGRGVGMAAVAPPVPAVAE